MKEVMTIDLETLTKKFKNLHTTMKTVHRLEQDDIDGLHTTGAGRADIAKSSRTRFGQTREPGSPSSMHFSRF